MCATYCYSSLYRGNVLQIFPLLGSNPSEWYSRQRERQRYRILQQLDQRIIEKWNPAHDYIVPLGFATSLGGHGRMA